jgi:hypothetical protein
MAHGLSDDAAVDTEPRPPPVLKKAQRSARFSVHADACIAHVT